MLLTVMLAAMLGATVATAGGHAKPKPKPKHHKVHPQAYSPRIKKVRRVRETIGGKGGGTDPGNDYPSNLRAVAQDSRLDPWREYNRECTSFVAWALASRNGFKMPFYANARDWGVNAAARHYLVDHVPAPGSVAWSTSGVYGHVAFVEDVIGNKVHIEEYNRLGNGRYDSRTVAASSFTGYIHFKDLSSAPGLVISAPTVVSTVTATSGPTGGTNETVGGLTHTWSNPATAAGTEGPSIAAGQTVQVTCKTPGFAVADGNTWWYEIASSPWGGNYWASADAFYNDGASSGSLRGTPYFDPAVPDCKGTSNTSSSTTSSSSTSTTTAAAPTTTTTTEAPPPTFPETPGGVTHTWTNYTNAGGTEGPSIATSQTVAVQCKVTGFKVADGDTWWYRIASSPWNNAYYASADAFYNNGQTSGSLHGTPFVDPAVPNC